MSQHDLSRQNGTASVIAPKLTAFNSTAMSTIAQMEKISNNLKSEGNRSEFCLIQTDENKTHS